MKSLVGVFGLVEYAIRDWLRAVIRCSRSNNEGLLALNIAITKKIRQEMSMYIESLGCEKCSSNFVCESKIVDKKMFTFIYTRQIQLNSILCNPQFHTNKE